MPILFYSLIIFLLFIIYLFYNQLVIRENILPNMSNSAVVNDLPSMRTFLESAYAVCFSNSNIVNSGTGINSLCYKISILGTNIPAVLSNVINVPMNQLFTTYGSPEPPLIPNGSIPPVPILTSTQDYIMLLQLYIAGSNLTIFSTGNSPIWIQDISGTETITNDLCQHQTLSSSYIIGYSIQLYNIIEECLRHFHNQMSSNEITLGDISDTSSYSEGMMSDYHYDYMYEMKQLGKMNIVNGNPRGEDFYSEYQSMDYTDFKSVSPTPIYSLSAYAPSGISKFRVLLIGAGGGGGSASGGKYNNNGGDQQGGGGGGGGGGGITYSAKFPYSPNYVITVGYHGLGGASARGGNQGSPGSSGNSSILYDNANGTTVANANGGYGGSGGILPIGNSGNYIEGTGPQGAGGAGGTGDNNNGNSGKGSASQTANGGDAGSSVEWSSMKETSISPLNGGAGGNAPAPGGNNGRNTGGNAGNNGSDGFVRVYWIP